MNNPFNFNMQTNVNGQPNYQVGLQMDSGLFDQANQAFRGLMSGFGSSGGGGGAGQGVAPLQSVQGNQLMSTQLAGLLSQNSPYMDRARQEGMNMASRRGLSNSSIAAGNSMGAAIDRAAPIAGFDAGRYGSVADQNQAASLEMARANAAASGQASAADSARRGQLESMFLGHQFGALDDYRRHMLGMETREDDQAFRGGQADIDRFINQDQFYRNYGLNRDQFDHGVGMDWANFGHGRDQDLWQRDFNSQQADRGYGLDRDRFGHGVGQDLWQRGFDQDRWAADDRFRNTQADRGYGLDRDRFDHGADMDWANHGLNRDRFGADNAHRDRVLNSQNYQTAASNYWTMMNNIMTNPQLTAEEISASAANFRAQYPGFANEIWGALPPGMMSSGAVEAAQMLPPMGPTRP